MTSANPTPSPFSQARRKRGFNLIEAAVVLGVVGVVIGGIWVAASQIKRRLLINNIVESVYLQIYPGIKEIYPKTIFPPPGDPLQTNISDLLEIMGRLPANWNSQSNSDGIFTIPYNNSYGRALLLSYPPAWQRIYFAVFAKSQADANAITEAFIQRQSRTGAELNSLYCADWPQTTVVSWTFGQVTGNCPLSSSGEWVVAVYLHPW